MEIQIPPSTHPAWHKILTGDQTGKFEFLAVQLIVMRLRLKVARDSSPQMLNRCIQELREMFVENAKTPKVQRDLIKIFGNGGLS